jgi:UDP-N-acetylmuramate: L-alanyl-gamma-D-glutamyl-meso-diaminopimelate ligase
VVEADEYDTAFFDKRSKFVHYKPRTLIINNLEFDHADIFPDLAAIQRQFHHLVRTVPGQGRILVNPAEQAVQSTLEMGCWSEVENLQSVDGWQAELITADGSAFKLLFAGAVQAEVRWGLLGQHNVHNALAAIGAARHAGVRPVDACAALSCFKGVKRRMELRGEVAGVKVYDDFAHHPTAIETTLAGARAQSPQGRIFAVLEPRSNTMKMGVHSGGLADSLAVADHSFVYQGPGVDWDVVGALHSLEQKVTVHQDLDTLVAAVSAAASAGDRVVVMSNGGFGGVHDKLLTALSGD